MSIITPEQVTVLHLPIGQIFKEVPPVDWCLVADLLRVNTRSYKSGDYNLVFPREIKTVLEMRQALQLAGFNFEPKNQVVLVPQITDERLGWLVGKSKINIYRPNLDYTYEYLSGECISDTIFKKHKPDREDWREWMNVHYGELFVDVYRKPNQLAGCRMTGMVAGQMQLIGRAVAKNGHEKMGEDLIDIGLRLTKAIRGTSVIDYDVFGIKGKIWMVRFYEKNTLRALNLLAGEGAPRKGMLAT